MVFRQPGWSDGAQSRTTPVVGCAQATTSRPAFGAGPSGTTSIAETATGSPFIPVER